MNKQLLILIILTIGFVSCDKKNNTITEEPVPTNKEISRIGLQKPSNVPYWWDPRNFEYDAQGRINKFYLGSETNNKREVSYVNDNLITVTYKIPVTGYAVDVTESIVMKNKLVDYILKKRIFTNITTHKIEIEKDSIVFGYADNALDNVLFYRNIGSSNTYQRVETFKYEYVNGNVSKLTRNSFDNIKTSTYKYDNENYIKFSDYVFDTPYNFDILYPLYFDKIGLKNKNNIIRIDNDQPVKDTRAMFEYINISKTLNLAGKIEKINFSGKSISSNNTNVGVFDNAMVIFTY